VSTHDDGTLLSSTIPVEVLVRDRLALVVGGGGEALSKLRRLTRAGARIEWFPDGATAEDRAAGVALGATILDAPPEEAVLATAAIVFFTTEQEERGALAATSARARGTLVCTLDRPDHSTFVNPAVAEGAGVRLSISTGGASPGLARRLREELERLLAAPELAPFVATTSRLRAKLPRGERFKRMSAIFADLRLEGRWTLPTIANGGD